MSVQADGRERVGVPTQRAGEQAHNMALLQPDPKYSPEQVVRIQIEALGKKDIPHKNAGCIPRKQAHHRAARALYAHGQRSRL
jgi:hypothetical protein